MKVIRILGIVIGTLAIAILLGPRSPSVTLDPVIQPMVSNLSDLQGEIEYFESQFDNIRADNHAELFWADSTVVKTDYALVYLHGYSASKGEGDPLHLEFAQKYGMNAYLARLDDHGLDEEDAMKDLTPASLLESAKRAIAIGNLIGDKVIVMSCSTGSTLALYLAAHNPDLVEGLICYSPNIDIYDQNSHLIDGPWGRQILKLVKGGNYHSWEANDSVQKYWTTKYHIDALVDLRLLMDATMTDETFAAVEQPMLMLYYYQDEEHQDNIVSVTAMLDMYDKLGTPKGKKQKFAIPDAGHHVIASRHQSKDLETVRKYTFGFAENILEIR